uniref:Histone H2A n=1 Tax=Cyanistes caeruleus TaxID=156563 RepID=A0A8C0UFG9_CYACU
MSVGRGKSSSKARAKAKSHSSRAGLQFPAGRVYRLLRRGHYSERVGTTSLVHLAAVSQATRHVNKELRINPRHIQLAVRNEEELNKLLGSVTTAKGGVLAHRVLLHRKARKTESEKPQEQ